MTPEEQAAFDAQQEKQIRDLASQITSMSKLGFDPMTVRKGVVAAIADTTSPPTVSINISGDSETLVSQVRTLNNYTPIVGQTVLIGKQGTEIFLLGAIASVNPAVAADANTSDNGWIKATLTNGTHFGGGNDIYYRRVLDHGSWKMQWRGAWNTDGNATMIASTEALGTDYRPAAARNVACARDSNNASLIRGNFSELGTVTFSQAIPGLSMSSVTLSPGGSTDVRLSGYLSQGGSDLGHSHAWGDSSSHSHSGSSVSIATAVWISLNGVEYFL